MAQRYDIVIGYHANDLEFAERLQDKLQRSGFRVWYKKPSEDRGQVSEALLGCQVYIPVMTEEAAVDKDMQEQLSLAYISDSAVYPLSKIRYRYLAPKLSGGARLMLAKINWCFVFNMDEFDTKVDTLIKSMKKDVFDVQTPRSQRETFRRDEFSLDKALTHGLDLEGAAPESDGSTFGVNMSDIGNNMSFWDRHFQSQPEVSWVEFRDRFLLDYGQKVEEEFPDVNEEKQKFVVNLMYKEIFNRQKMVSRNSYMKFCVKDNPHAFFSRLLNYTVAYLSLRELLSMDSGLRISTIQSLGEFSFPAIVLGLSDMLRDEDPNIRAVAAIALAHAGKEDPSAVTNLVALLEDEDRLVRESACLSLGYIRSPAAVPHIVDRWRNDPISTVREAAELALSKFDSDDAQRCMKVTKVLSSEMSALKPKA